MGYCCKFRAGTRTICYIFSFLILPVILVSTPFQANAQPLKHGDITVDYQSSVNSISISINYPEDLAHQIETVLNPPRIITDVLKAQIPRYKALDLPDNQFVKSIRLGTHKDKTRVVFDLHGSTLLPYEIEKKPGQLLFIFSNLSRAATSPIPESPKIKVKRLTAPGSKLNQVENEKEDKVDPEITETKATSGSMTLSISKKALQESAELKFSVDQIRVRFSKGDRQVKNISLTNKTENPLYLSASALEVASPGTPAENRAPSNNLIVTPKHIVLPPEGSRMVRLFIRNLHQKEEQVYRVTFIPQKDPFSEETLKALAKGSSIKLSVLTGLGILVTSEPAAPIAGFEWLREKEVISLQNKGNVNVLLEDAVLCAGEGACQSIPPLRLYAGNAVKLRIPENVTFRFMKRSGKDFEQVIIPPSTGN